MKLKQKVVLYFALFVIIIFIVAAFFMFKESSELTALEANLIKHSNTSKIYICDTAITDDSRFIGDFKKRSQTKISGSSPIRFYKLVAKAGNLKNEFFIGQDSVDSNLFWIYPYEKPKIMTPLAYLRTNTLAESIKTDCIAVKDEWVNIYIPKS